MTQLGGEPFGALPCEKLPVLQCDRYCSLEKCVATPHAHFPFTADTQIQKYAECCAHVASNNPDLECNWFYFDLGSDCYRVCAKVGAGEPFVTVTPSQFSLMLGYKLQFSTESLNTLGMSHPVVTAVRGKQRIRLETLLFGVHHSRLVLLDRCMTNFQPNRVLHLQKGFTLQSAHWPHLKGLHKRVNNVSWRKPMGKLRRGRFEFDERSFSSFHTAVLLLLDGHWQYFQE